MAEKKHGARADKRRIGATAVRRTDAFVDAIIDSVEPIDREIAKRAAKLRASHQTIRLPDALVLATGQARGASTILTADRRWAGVDRRVQVVVA